MPAPYAPATNMAGTNATASGYNPNITDGDIRLMWQKGVQVWEQTTDFWAPMEGGSNAVIETVTDTSKGRGQKITFTNMAGLYNEPKLGDELFEDGSSFEEINLNHYDLSVDYLRHGVRYTERLEEVMGMRGEIVAGVPRELGKWLGRQKSEKMFMAFLHQSLAANRIYANNRASAAALTKSDVFSWEDIVAARTQLERLNGAPAKVGTDRNGNAINRYIAVSTTDSLFGFEVNDLKTLIGSGNTDTQGAANLLWSGGFHDIRGTMIKKYNPIDHDGVGAIGSPLNPKALLGCYTGNGFTATAKVLSGDALTANTVYGGGVYSAPSANKLFFKYFPLHQFKFLYGETLNLASSLYGSGVFYIAVVNPPNAPTDPGKVGYYQVNANGGSTLTVNARLVSGNAAGVAWTGSPAFNATYNTNVHHPGSAIYLCNAAGVYIGHTLLLGKMAARRGYGKHRNQRTDDQHEGGFVKDIFITTVFGQSVCKDAAGRVPGYLVLTHAVEYAGVPLGIP
jgi:hypothetical protein